MLKLKEEDVQKLATQEDIDRQKQLKDKEI